MTALPLFFYKNTDKEPAHKQEIVYFKGVSNFYALEIHFKECCVEYLWEEFDPVDGCPTGTTVVYDPNYPKKPGPDYKKIILLDHHVLRHYLWYPRDDFFNQFKKYLGYTDDDF